MAVKSGAEIWRDHITNGVPASGAHNVDKADMRDWMSAVEQKTVPIAGLSYAWVATLSGDPGAGGVAIDADNSNNAAEIRVSTSGADGQDFAAVLAAWTASSNPVKGRIEVVAVADKSRFLVADVSGIADHSTYVTATILPYGAGLPFEAADQLSVLFVRAGDKGAPNTLSIGTVATGAAGSDAAANITGSAPSQTLNLTIPAGVKGDQGEPGATGPAGDLASFSGTSATSIAVPSVGATVTWTTQPGKGWVAGQQLLVASSGSTAAVTISVASYSGTSLAGVVTAVTGTGTHTDWLIGPTGTTLAGPANAVLVDMSNMYATASQQSGKYINGSGVIGTASGWAVSDYMPVTPGLNYTISSNAARQHGVGFYATYGATSVVSGGYVGATDEPLTVTAPEGAAYMVIAVKTPSIAEPSEIMVNLGSAAISYSAYGVARYGIAETAIIPEILAARGDAATLGDRLDATDAVIVDASNLYDPTAKNSGHYVHSTGNIYAAAGWSCSDYIPVTAGLSYTIAANGTRQGGVAFYASNTTTAPISGSASFDDANPLTLVAPAGAAYMVLNVVSTSYAEPSEIMVNLGAYAPPFVAFGGAERAIADDVSVPEVVAARAGFSSLADRLDKALQKPGLLTLGGATGTSYVEATRDGVTVRQEFTLGSAGGIATPDIFNFRDLRVDGLLLKYSNDDVAPYHSIDWTIGANHGWAMSSCTVTGHDKATADIGSVWTAGGTQFVLVGIADANTLYLACRSGNSPNASATTYTHVTGATHTASFAVSAATVTQMYQVFQNRQQHVFVDGVEVPVEAATYYYSTAVEIVETYEVLPRADVIAWLEAHGSGGTVVPTGTPLFAVSMVYRFDQDANCTIDTDYLSMASHAMQDIMWVQCIKMLDGADGTVQYYIPKVSTTTHYGTPYSFQLIATPVVTGWGDYLNFTPALCADAGGWPASRAVQLTDNYGLAIGFLPVGSTSVANRAANTTTKRLSISSSGAKLYMAGIDKGAGTAAAGTYYSTTGYRNVIVRPDTAGRTCVYPVRTRGKQYLFMDWHNIAATERVAIPADFIGRSFSVVDSRNCTLLSSALTGHVAVTVAASGDYAFLILEVTS